MHACVLNDIGGEIIQNRGGEVTQVILLSSGCSTTRKLRIRIAPRA